MAIVEISKLKFNLQELPEGDSHRTVDLDSKDLELKRDEVSLLKARIEIDFYKTDQFVEVKFNLEAETKLICDRSLEPFTKKLSGSYHLLFDPNIDEPSETEKGAVRQIPVHDLTVDIGPDVRDTIMLEVPIRKIHPDYIDADGNLKTFETKKFGPDSEDDDTIDPRWAELKKLKQN